MVPASPFPSMSDLSLYGEACDALYHSRTLPLYYPVIPDFGSPIEWEHPDVLKPPSPSTQSQQSLLCLLSSQHHSLTHCPYIVDLLPLLLRYFDDPTTYALTSSMLSPSSHHTAHSFYFTLSSPSYLIFVKKCYLFLKELSEKLKHHIKYLGVDSVTLFIHWVERLFVSFLPHSALPRFMDGYVYYGLPWLWAFALAMLDVHRKGVLACASIDALSELVFTDVAMGDVGEYVVRAVELMPKVVKWNESVKPKEIESTRWAPHPTHGRPCRTHQPSLWDRPPRWWTPRSCRRCGAGWRRRSVSATRCCCTPAAGMGIC